MRPGPPRLCRGPSPRAARFREIQEDLGISANVLSDRLDALVSDGILEQHLYQERPRRYEYRLTEKGAELVPALLALMQWGDRWKWPDGHGPVRVEHADCGHEVLVEVRCSHCQRAVANAELRARARPGVTPIPVEHDPGHVTGERLLSSADGLRLGR
ncbi:MAG TPA: helix-turn-helix domain-containing protein [Solirubrobacteraceae bacterium]